MKSLNNINPDAVHSFNRPNVALILIRKTQKKVHARQCANGYSLANGDFIHHTAVKFIKTLEEA